MRVISNNFKNNKLPRSRDIFLYWQNEHQKISKFNLVQDDQLTFTCSKWIVEALEKGAIVYSKLTIKTPEWRHWHLLKVLTNPLVDSLLFDGKVTTSQ